MRQYLLNSVWPLLATSGAPMARGWNVYNDSTAQEQWSEMNLQVDPLSEYESMRANRDLYHLMSTKVIWMIGSKGEVEVALQEAHYIREMIHSQIN